MAMVKQTGHLPIWTMMAFDASMQVPMTRILMQRNDHSRPLKLLMNLFDVIEIEKLLNGTSITSFGSLRSRMSDTNLGVEISLGVNEAGEEQQITLEGVTVDELSASNFAFVDVL